MEKQELRVQGKEHERDREALGERLASLILEEQSRSASRGNIPLWERLLSLIMSLAKDYQNMDGAAQF
jgi:hypothetical protein